MNVFKTASLFLSLIIISNNSSKPNQATTLIFSRYRYIKIRGTVVAVFHLTRLPKINNALLCSGVFNRKFTLQYIINYMNNIQK